MTNANFNRANCYCSNFEYADCEHAHFRQANLAMCNFANASLKYANLNEAILIMANCYEVTFERAILCAATFYDVDVCDADFKDTFIFNAVWTKTNLGTAKNVPYIPMVCPETGEFYGYVKLCDDLIATILIPADAKRSSGSSRLCRTNKAKVVKIETLGGVEVLEGTSVYNETYKTGEWIEDTYFINNRWSDNHSGIEFLIQKKEAELW